MCSLWYPRRGSFKASKLLVTKCIPIFELSMSLICFLWRESSTHGCGRIEVHTLISPRTFTPTSMPTRRAKRHLEATHSSNERPCQVVFSACCLERVELIFHEYLNLVLRVRRAIWGFSSITPMALKHLQLPMNRMRGPF